MPYQPNLNFKLSNGTDLGNLGWITKEYLMTVYPQIANQLITPELWIWGFNYGGRLGIDFASFLSAQTPITTFAGGANWKQIAAGNGYYAYSAAIKTDGTLWTWGNNYSGQLGDNTTIVRSTPVTTFAGGTNWKQVSAAAYHTAAVKTDGTLWAWGRNYDGQIGDDTTNISITPVTTFAGGTNWKQVAAGYKHTAAVKTDGTLWNWGVNFDGQLGNTTTDNSYTPITTFAGGTNWKQVACGYNHTIAIKTDGTLWIWGNNYSGQLGNNTTNSTLTPITTFVGGTNWKQVAGSGFRHTAAVKTDGTLWIWGANYEGQLGNNTIISRSTPVTTFAGGTNWKQITCGYNYTAAIKTDGTLWAWGRNVSGQMGDNTSTIRLTPVTTFAGGTNWKQIACGQNHTMAIKTSDDLQGI